jgi:hypothetical protein
MGIGMEIRTGRGESGMKERRSFGDLERDFFESLRLINRVGWGRLADESGRLNLWLF